MPVALLPPVSGGGGEWRGQVPISAANRYVRGQRNGRWHRGRYGVLYPPLREGETGHLIIGYWCGPHGSEKIGADTLLMVDEAPAGESVCGTCFGRALGAGQDEAPTPFPPLIFSPRWVNPPALCPGSRNKTIEHVSAGDRLIPRIAKCLICLQLVKTRARGSPYYPDWGAEIHPSGPDGLAVDPCPFHAWNQLTTRGGQVRCYCGWDPDKAGGWLPFTLIR